MWSVIFAERKKNQIKSLKTQKLDEKHARYMIHYEELNKVLEQMVNDHINAEKAREPKNGR